MTFLRIVITLYLFDLSMIFSENRYPLFRIMLLRRNGQRLFSCPSNVSSPARIARIRRVQTFNYTMFEDAP
jgi:hypothetical protein